jgi:IS4 transposase
MKQTAGGAVDILGEYSGARLGDPRRSARLQKIVAAVTRKPDAGFPKLMTTSAELEGFYRFLCNEQVSVDAIPQPHIDATLARLQALDEVLAVHDMSVFTFSGESRREGLGAVQQGKTQGCFGHFSLAVSTDERRDPLGVLGLHTWVRGDDSPTKRRKQGKLKYRDSVGLQKESDRWGELADVVRQRVGDVTSLVHVMDSEADDYALMARLVGGEQRFVIRMCYDRVLAADQQGTDRGRRTREFVASRRVACKRTAQLSARKRSPLARGRKRGRARQGRQARLAFAAAPLLVRRPGSQRSEQPPVLALNVVRAHEIDPPAGFEPVEWILFTTEPIKTKEQILRVADIYRARWRIEEYFKALKTGCAYEKRQPESYDTLLKALAVFVPIAWNLLRIRTLSRAQQDAPASMVLTKTHRAILRQLPETRALKIKTARDAFLAIARLGGHIKQNGDPGWIVLGRGYEDLLKYEVGCRTALNRRASKTWDQS